MDNILGWRGVTKTFFKNSFQILEFTSKELSSFSIKGFMFKKNVDFIKSRRWSAHYWKGIINENEKIGLGLRLGKFLKTKLSQGWYCGAFTKKAIIWSLNEQVFTIIKSFKTDGLDDPCA